MGSKNKPIAVDWAQFDKLAAMQCTQEEVAAWFDCAVEPLDKACRRHRGLSLAECLDMGRGKGKISLRRAQFQKALQGNARMQVWLGKQYLDQADKVDTHFIKKMSDEDLTMEVRRILEKEGHS